MERIHDGILLWFTETRRDGKDFIRFVSYTEMEMEMEMER